VHALARAGIAMLPVPDNYYEDLDARFALPEQELSALRESGILYDRDAHGEFRHCYTATYGRVFLELVERRGDYQGFGAANAPVRLAAQRAAGPAGRS
jgi:4-hydroxyphenylpyruvate dioxygenase